MNDERDRPYICRAPGCSQRFQTEDHLMIHRHKHEMTLKFPSIKADNAFSDQTPTPTRFLRNCDAVGLFNEIEEEFRQAQEEEQNKQSLNQNGSSCANLPQARLQHQLKPHLQHPVQTDAQAQHHHPQTQGQAHLIGPSCSMNAQQTLASSQAGSVVSQATAALTHSGPIPGPLSSLLHMRNRQRRPLPPSMPGTLPDPTIQGASAHHMAMERQMSSSVSPSLIGVPGPAHSTSCSSPQRSKPPAGHQMQHHPGSVAGSNRMTIMGHMMEMMSQRHRPSHLQQEQHHQLQAPPTSYQQHCHAPPPQHMGNAHSHQIHQSGSAAHPQVHQSPPSHLHSGHSHQGSPHMSLHSLSPQTSPEQRQSLHHSHSQNPSGGGRRRRTLDQDPDERRQKFLERNRAAATRCRQKRKVWVGSLEKKAEELTHTNMQLQNEVTSLKSEVGQLKQILLTHKDCPVTARQREAQGYPNAGMSLGEHAAPVCQQQAIQHNSISTSSAAGGDKGHQRHAGN